MIITQAHVDFWQSKQQKPKWIAKFLGEVEVKQSRQLWRRERNPVDTLINAQTEIRPAARERNMNVNNTLVLLRRKSGDELLIYLDYLAGAKNAAKDRDIARCKYARRWAAKIRKNRGEKAPDVRDDLILVCSSMSTAVDAAQWLARTSVPRQQAVYALKHAFTMIERDAENLVKVTRDADEH